MEPAPAPAAVPAIRMEEVTAASVHGRTAPRFERVNWNVQPGEFWVVAGLQGTGKTDLLMHLAGLIGPERGRHEMFGEEMPIFDEDRLSHRLRIGLVFDGGQLFSQLTVRENIALSLRYHHNLTKAEAEAEVGEMLEATELLPWADSTPGAIGRQWQKRVGLARALVLRPEIVLVDNPMAGLDWVHVAWWLGFLEGLSRGHECLQSRPATVVVTTADLRPWKGRACQFAILCERRLAVLGGWDQLERADASLIHGLLAPETPGD